MCHSHLSTSNTGIAAQVLPHSSGQPPPSSSGPKTCFACTRLNASTFRVVEDDKWREQPFIYAKIYEDALVLVDTGCGGAAREPDVELSSLRAFLETVPIAENGGRPLNEGGSREYVVVCTHCHYDHIGGIEQFGNLPGTRIWASGHDRDFIVGDGRLPTSSLCDLVGMETPEYKVTDWALDGQHVTRDDDGHRDLGLQIFQTPGHTPDELALWDGEERVLYVGDSLYELAVIIFPPGAGSLTDYNDTLDKLQRLVQGWNVSKPESASPSSSARRTKIACGHITHDADAETLLREVDVAFYECALGRYDEKIEDFRGVETVTHSREGSKISFRSPKQLWDEFRRDADAMASLKRRHEKE